MQPNINPEEALPQNPSDELLAYWASRSELFERSKLQVGIPRED